MSVATVGTQDFQKEVLEHKGVVFVDFYADWCAPCKVTEPVVHALADEMKDVKFVKVDVDANADLASQYSIFSIPTFIIFKDGKNVSQFAGAAPREHFEQEINKALS